MNNKKDSPASIDIAIVKKRKTAGRQNTVSPAVHMFTPLYLFGKL
ncbi:hypothetical protein [Paenibacillus sp. BAC0078]